MYKLLRNTHLALGLFGALFLLVYGWSSVQMAHNSWFNLKPDVTEADVDLQGVALDNPRAVRAGLGDQHGMTGEMRQLQTRPDGFGFRIIRTGVVYEVTYVSAANRVKVRTNRAGFMGILNRLHHLGGLWHDYAPFNLWGAAVGLVSIGLIGLGLTGIYLWFKLHEERVIGALLLVASLGYSLTLLVLVRTA